MNIYRDSCIPITQFGGTSMSGERTNFTRQELWHCINAGQSGIIAQTSLPDGNRPPVTWRMPLKAGAISSVNKLNGIGSMSGNGNLGYQILASISGSGTISDALGTLIVDLLASISGTGEISSASMEAFLFALASISGSGGISDADLEGFGELIALMEGEGGISSTLLGTGELSASITSYGSLTPEGIRDSIWRAVAANYNDSGSMGEQLNNVGAGANPWTAPIEGVYTAQDIMKILFSVLAGKTVIVPGTGETATVTFRDVNDTTNRLVADMDGSERIGITIDAT